MWCSGMGEKKYAEVVRYMDRKKSEEFMKKICE